MQREKALQVSLAFAALASVATAQVRNLGDVTTLTVPTTPSANMDYVNAKAMDLPMSLTYVDPVQAQVTALLTASSFGTAGISDGSPGTGAQSPVSLGTPPSASADNAAGGFTSQEFGTSGQSFSTARADLSGLTTTNSYPYRAAGKLFFNIGASTFVCSASLIKRGIVVTAAHCAAKYGASKFHSNWRFVPAYRSGLAPFNTWTVRQAWVKTSYFNGTDGCLSGVVCPNDVAVLTLNTIGGGYAGTATGWLGYGWNGYGFSGNTTHLSQLGYPVCLDNGQLMERNDSGAFVSASLKSNTVIGSLMCGGSSGGPWALNLGVRPALTGTTSGSAALSNVVVGVTSWGYTSTAVKQQGGSPFTTNNIVSLVNSACGAVPGACI